MAKRIINTPGALRAFEQELPEMRCSWLGARVERAMQELEDL